VERLRHFVIDCFSRDAKNSVNKDYLGPFAPLRGKLGRRF
jgi:hypothetical protein